MAGLRRSEWEQEYVVKQCQKNFDLFKPEVLNDPNWDKDIHNLKSILYSIRPYSRWWRYGFMKSLQRAIKALEKENMEKRKNNC